MRKSSIRYVLLVALSLGLCGCAKTYYITRWNGGQVGFESYKWGDQTYTYNVEFYENGKVKQEHYGFSRNISSLVGQALDGLAKAIGAGVDKLCGLG